MKKFNAVLLLAVLLFSQTALADEAVPQEISLPPASISGMIVEETETTLLVESSVDGGKSVILNLESNPYVVDCVSGLPMALADRTDDQIIAYYGPVETRSLPPISNAVLIICNIPADYIPPQYWRVEAVSAVDENTVQVTVDGGGLIVTIGRNTPIAPYLTRNIVTIDNIGVGTELLLWYPVVAQSFPAQATATQAVLLGSPATPGDIEIADEPAPEGFSVGTTSLTGSDDIGGIILQFQGDEAVTGPLNKEIENFYENSIAELDEGQSLELSSAAFPGDVYTSVVVYAITSDGESRDTNIYTLVLKTDDFSRQTLTDLLGVNAYKLASNAIARQIEAGAAAPFYANEGAFKGVDENTAFYLDARGDSVIICDKYEGAESVQMFTIALDDVVNIDIAAQDTFIEDSILFVPLRAAAEALGFTLSWDDAAKGITLAKNEQSHTVAIGSVQSGGQELEAAPVLVDGQTFIPLSFFAKTLDACYLVEEGKVVISAIK